MDAATARSHPVGRSDDAARASPARNDDVRALAADSSRSRWRSCSQRWRRLTTGPQAQHAQPAAASRPAVSAAGSRAARSARSRRVAEARPDHGRARHRRRLDGRRHRRRRRLVHDPAGAPRRTERRRLRAGRAAPDARGDQAARAARRAAERPDACSAHGSDPNLPARALDAVLVVDAYQEVERPRRRFCATWRARSSPTAASASSTTSRAAAARARRRTCASSEPSVEADARGRRPASARRSENLPYQYLLVLGR